MDAASAESLLRTAEDAHVAMRRGEDASAIQLIETHYPDIREAMAWCLAEGRTDEADRFASALVPFWMATKRIDDGHRWYERALGSSATSPRRARAVYDDGYLVFWAGRYELAGRRFTEARRLAQDFGDHDVVALALAGSARVALNTDPGEAIRLLREAIEVTRDMPDSLGRSSANHVLGVALQMAGDLEAAREVMDERLEHARTTGNHIVVSVESANLSMVERQLGNLDRAEALSLEALRIDSRTGDAMAVPWVINGLAAVTAAQGRLERAAILLGMAESLLERAGGEWPPDEREQYEGTLATLAAGLSPAGLGNARSAGAAMSLDAAVAFALSGV